MFALDTLALPLLPSAVPHSESRADLTAALSQTPAKPSAAGPAGEIAVDATRANASAIVASSRLLGAERHSVFLALSFLDARSLACCCSASRHFTLPFHNALWEAHARADGFTTSQLTRVWHADQMDTLNTVLTARASALPAEAVRSSTLAQLEEPSARRTLRRRADRELALAMTELHTSLQAAPSLVALLTKQMAKQAERYANDGLNPAATAAATPTAADAKAGPASGSDAQTDVDLFSPFAALGMPPPAASAEAKKSSSSSTASASDAKSSTAPPQAVTSKTAFSSRAPPRFFHGAYTRHARNGVFLVPFDAPTAAVIHEYVEALGATEFSLCRVSHPLPSPLPALLPTGYHKLALVLALLFPDTAHPPPLSAFVRVGIDNTSFHHTIRLNVLCDAILSERLASEPVYDPTWTRMAEVLLADKSEPPQQKAAYWFGAAPVVDLSCVAGDTLRVFVYLNRPASHPMCVSPPPNSNPPPKAAGKATDAPVPSLLLPAERMYEANEYDTMNLPHVKDALLLFRRMRPLVLGPGFYDKRYETALDVSANAPAVADDTKVTSATDSKASAAATAGTPTPFGSGGALAAAVASSAASRRLLEREREVGEFRPQVRTWNTSEVSPLYFNAGGQWTRDHFAATVYRPATDTILVARHPYHFEY